MSNLPKKTTALRLDAGPSNSFAFISARGRYAILYPFTEFAKDSPVFGRQTTPRGTAYHAGLFGVTIGRVYPKPANTPLRLATPPVPIIVSHPTDAPRVAILPS